MSCSIDKRLRKLSKDNAKVNPDPKKQQTYDKTLFDLQGLLAHEFADKMKPGSLLDVGTAYGTLAGYFAERGWKVTAVDALPELSSPVWWGAHEIDFHEVNVETQPLPGQHDLVLFTEVIEHLNYNPVPVIERLFEATKPGGTVICTTPMKELQGIYHPNNGRYANYLHYRDIPHPWNGYQFIDDHHYFYLKGELAQLFHEVGFQVVDCYPIRHGTTHMLIARRPE